MCESSQGSLFSRGRESLHAFLRHVIDHDLLLKSSGTSEKSVRVSCHSVVVLLMLLCDILCLRHMPAHDSLDVASVLYRVV